MQTFTSKCLIIMLCKTDKMLKLCNYSDVHELKRIYCKSVQYHNSNCRSWAVWLECGSMIGMIALLKKQYHNSTCSKTRTYIQKCPNFNAVYRSIFADHHSNILLVHARFFMRELCSSTSSSGANEYNESQWMTRIQALLILVWDHLVFAVAGSLK